MEPQAKEARTQISAPIAVFLAFFAFAELATAQESGAPPVPEPEIQQAGLDELQRMGRILFNRAKERFAAADYAEAAQLFEQAYRLSQHPELLYNVALSCERSGQIERAIDTYQLYTITVPEGRLAEESRSRVLSLQALLKTMEPAAVAEQAAEPDPGNNEPTGPVRRWIRVPKHAAPVAAVTKDTATGRMSKQRRSRLLFYGGAALAVATAVAVGLMIDRGVDYAPPHESTDGDILVALDGPQ